MEFTYDELASLCEADEAADRDEALADLLDSPEYDALEECFFGEVSSDQHTEFTAKLKAANAIPAGQQRTWAMAAAAEWLIAKAEARRVKEANEELDARRPTQPKSLNCSLITRGAHENRPHQ